MLECMRLQDFVCGEASKSAQLPVFTVGRLAIHSQDGGGGA